MKVLIIAPPLLPIPAVNGGAIESLVDDFLKYNSNNNNFEITVYSLLSKKITHNMICKYNNTNFRYVNKRKVTYQIFKIKKLLIELKKENSIPSSYALYVINDLKRKHELDKYDLVIIENQIKSLTTYRKYIKSKIVSHIHNDYLNKDTVNSKMIVKACDEFWCVSNFIANQIKKIDNNVKTRVLYNGVDLEKFSSPVEENLKRKMYSKIGFKKNDFIIIFVGRIMPEKGVLELVRAFNTIKDDNIKLLIVGGLKDKSIEIINYNQKVVSECKKNINNIFLFGKANFEELKVLYSISNLQIVPSIWDEAFGLIAVEGICTGHPVIVTNSGGLPEIITCPSLIIDRNNIERNICNKIKELYSTRCESININELKKSINKFKIDTYCNNFKNCVIDIINNS